MTTTLARTDYEALLSRVRQALAEGRARAKRVLEREEVRTWWEAAKIVNEHLRIHNDRAEYGKKVIPKLAGDLGVSESYLYDILQFQKFFPIPHSSGELTLTHYRTLARLENFKERNLLYREAVRRRLSVPELLGEIRSRKLLAPPDLKLEKGDGRAGWTAPELMERIKKEIWENGTRSQAPSSQREISSFQPKRGVLHTYQVLHLEHVGLKGEHSGSEEPLSINLGFSTFMGLPGGIAKHFKENDIVEGKMPAGAGGAPLLKKLPRATPADLYTYHAGLVRVIDADTHWMRIHLGLFNLKLRQKLRLRGIDAPELNTQAGQKAKRFVEKQFKTASEIIITTTKPDKYDRYLSDVWLDGVNLNKLLLESGHARLKSDFSDDDWNLANWGRF